MNQTLRILGFTAVETITLSVWLALAQTSGSYVAAGVLFIGLLIEHILNVNTVLKQNYLQIDGTRILGIVGFTITETATWIGWLALLKVNPFLAFGVLTVGLLIEHNQTDNVIRRKNFFGNLLNLKALGHTLVESVGGSVWFRLVQSASPIFAVIVLFVTSLVHHIIAVANGQETT